MEYGLTTTELQSKHYQLFAFDLIPTTDTPLLEIEINNVKGELQLRNDEDIEKHVAEYLKENIHCSDMMQSENKSKSLFSFTHTPDNDYTYFRQKIQLTLSHIGSISRIGPTNTIICNQKTKNRHFKEDNYNFVIIINKYIDDNVLYILNNSVIDNPGYKLLTYNDKNNNDFYFDIVEVGNSAKLTALKFQIYEL